MLRAAYPVSIIPFFLMLISLGTPSLKNNQNTNFISQPALPLGLGSHFAVYPKRQKQQQQLGGAPRKALFKRTGVEGLSPSSRKVQLK